MTTHYSIAPEPTRLWVTEPHNADAVLKALGQLARAQELGYPTQILSELTDVVIDAAGADSHKIASVAW